MTAKEMFKQCKYHIVLDDKDEIIYRRKTSRKEKLISFSKYDGTICFDYFGSFVVDKDLLKAINKQYEELGWMENGL